MLIQSSRIKCIPTIEFGYNPHMYEPIALQRFPEISRRMGRGPGADLSDFLQLLFPFRIGLFFRQIPGFLAVPLCQTDYAVGGNVHSFELLIFLKGFWVIVKIQAFQAFFDIGFKIQEALFIDLIIQNCMARRPLFHKFCKHTSCKSIDPFRRHVSKDQVPEGLSFPIGDDFLLIDLFGLGIDGIRGLFPRIQDLQILRAVYGYLGIGGGGLNFRASLAYDQFPLIDADGFIFHDIFKS